MNWKVMQQAQLSSGEAKALQMKVNCSGGEIAVPFQEIPLNYVNEGANVNTKDGIISPEDVWNYVEELAFGKPEGAGAVKYLIFYDELPDSYLSSWNNSNGYGYSSFDADKVSSDNPEGPRSNPSTNLNRSRTTSAIVATGEYGYTSDAWESDLTIHELVHAMGGAFERELADGPPAANWVNPPYGSTGAHCTDGFDILCYDDMGKSVNGVFVPGPYTETRCPEQPYQLEYATVYGVPLDCGFDTYFDAQTEPGEWLAQWWNVGGAENPFLVDNGERIPQDALWGPGPIDSDVNGDGKADVVTLQTTGTAYTYQGANQGGGGYNTDFGMNSALFDGTGHHAIDVADVTGDRKADLVTLGADGKVNVYPGGNDGRFGSGVVAGTGFTPGLLQPGGHEPIGVARVTNDRHADLVTFHAPSQNFYVYPGSGSGQFGSGLTMGGGQINSALHDHSGKYFVDIADINGDDSADVVALTTSSSGTASVATYKGWEGGIIQNQSQIAPNVDPIMDNGVGSEPIGLGDVNGDGKADLVTLASSGQIAVHAGTNILNEPTQTYQLLADSPVLSLSGQVSNLMTGQDDAGDDFIDVVDKTGDGKADLVKVDPSGKLQVAPGRADLKFDPFVEWKTGVKSNRFGIEPGHEFVQEEYIRRRGCTVQACPMRPQPVESDVDGDWRSDLVTLDADGTSHTYRSIGSAAHVTSFAGGMNSALHDGTGHLVIDVADVTGDHRADKVTLHHDGNVYLYAGQSDGSFATTPTPSFGGTMKPGPHDPNGYEPIGVGDVTGDGYGDLVVFKPGEGLKVYPRGEGNSFGAPTVSAASLESALFESTGYRFHFLDVIDVNGDDHADVVAVNGSGQVFVYKGSTSGSLTTAGALPITVDFNLGDGVGYEPIGLGDVNRDHRADLALLRWDGAVKLYAGQADGSFGATWTSAAGLIDSNLLDGSGRELIGLLDQDGDRRYDVVAVGKTTGGEYRAYVYKGNSDLTLNSSPLNSGLPDFTPNRFKPFSGHEVATEKPFVMRPGCTDKGCFWPPVTVDADVGGDRRADLLTLHTDGSIRLGLGGVSNMHTTSQISDPGILDPALYDGIGHYPIDSADVDGDRRADLITLSGQGVVEVRRGNSDHRFAAPVVAAANLAPAMNGTGHFEPIAVADANGDELGDLIGYWGESGARSIRTYPGKADGSFETANPPARISLTGEVDSALLDGSGEYFLDAADVTGDGRADLIAMRTPGSVYVYQAQADGSFSKAGQAAAAIDPIMDDGSGHEPVGVADVDRDRRADLVTLATDGKLKIWKGQANGSFTAPSGDAYGTVIDSSLMDGTGYELIGLFDYDRDRDADLVAVKNGTSQGAYIYSFRASTDGAGTTTFGYPWNSGGDEFQARHHGKPGHEFVAEKPLVRRTGCAASGCRWVAQGIEGDVDGDRKADLTTLRSGQLTTAATAYVFKGDATGVLAAGGVASLSGLLDTALFDKTGEYAVDSADVDGDGRSDLVTQRTPGGVYVHRGQADRSFAAPILAASSITPLMNGKGLYEPVAVGDVTGDGRGDLVTTVETIVGIPVKAVVVFPGQAGGTFGSSISSLSGEIDSAFVDGSGEYFLDVVDVTGDGYADLVAIGDDGELHVYRGSGSGSLAAPVASPTVLDPAMDDGIGQEPVGLGDVTGDERADLVTLEVQTKELFLMPGQGDGRFAAPPGNLEEGFDPAYPGAVDSSLLDGQGEDLIGLLDYDGDSRADLVSTDGNGALRAYKAQAGGTFAAPVTSQGTVRSSRSGVLPGHEAASEKPVWRRAGCTPSGCQWPPPAPQRNWIAKAVPRPADTIEDVWCASSTNCIGVGSARDGSGLKHAQVVRWNGSSWAAEPTPQPAAGEAELAGISCTSASHCVAVGSKSAFGARQTLAMSWNGSAWSIETTPNPSNPSGSNSLTDVSCTSTTQCWAVGFGTHALALKLSSGSWSAASPSPPPGASESELSGVQCISSVCRMVGSSVASGTRKALSIGTLIGFWSEDASVHPAGASESRLADVDCISSSNCTMVGSYVASGTRKTLAASTASGSLQVVSTPNPYGAAGSRLGGLDCTSASACTAVGAFNLAGGSDKPLAMTWDGSAWSLQTIAPPDGTAASLLSGVGCPVASNCVATGTVSLAGNENGALAYRNPGSGWQLSEAGLIKGMLSSGISCATDAECTLVGFREVESNRYTSWARVGGSWQGPRHMAPEPSANWDITDVSCSAANQCTAVGFQNEPASSSQPLAERWDGSAWTEQTTPNPSGGSEVKFEGASCPSATSCTAVGAYRVASQWKPLAEAWNGSSWSLQSMPMPEAATDGLLKDVSCTSAGACLAAGYYVTSPGVYHPLVERWNGTAWSLETLPEPAGATSVTVNAVSCSAPNDCIAVGKHTDPQVTGHLGYAARWNGATWALQSPPVPEGGAWIVLNELSCASTSACIAVGEVQAEGLVKAYLLAWNGAAWSIEPVPPSPGGESTRLTSVSCSSAKRCVAGGWRQGGGNVLPVLLESEAGS